MNCIRCSGLLSKGYDEGERVEFVRCINCGDRSYPAFSEWTVVRTADPLLCVECGVAPRQQVRGGYRSVTEREVKRCQECREAYNRNRRHRKWAQREAS